MFSHPSCLAALFICCGLLAANHPAAAQNETPPDTVNPTRVFEARFGMNLKTTDTGELVVAEVRPNSPAAEAGLQKDDVLTVVDGYRFESSEKLAAYIKKTGVGTSVGLEVRRIRDTVQVLVGEYERILGLTIREDEGKRASVWMAASKSPAAEAGFQSRDRLVGVADKKTLTYKTFVDEFVKAITATAPGEVIPVAILREKQQHTLKIVRPTQVDLPKERVFDGPPVAATSDKPSPLLRPEGYSVGVAVLTNAGFSPAAEAPAVDNDVIVDRGPHAVRVEVDQRPAQPIRGMVTFSQAGDKTLVRLDASGLSQAQYIVALHEYGDCSNVAAGSAGMILGIKSTGEIPSGSLGTFRPVADGTATFSAASSELPRQGNGKLGVIGLAVILHRITPTDRGSTNVPVACGVVGSANPRFRIPVHQSPTPLSPK